MLRQPWAHRALLSLILPAVLAAMTLTSGCAQTQPAASQAANAKADAPASAAAGLMIYGPGGPAPAMREAAAAFAQARQVKVQVTAGPTPRWKDDALQHADLIYSGAEFMMSDFVLKDFKDLVDARQVQTLYLRPSAILVRKGNPQKLRGVRDLARPGVRLLVVQGAGQTGLWEDVAGRTGDARLVDAIRRNIRTTAANSAEAKQRWLQDDGHDAWLIWRIWQHENPQAADLVATEPEHTIYRSVGIVPTRQGRNAALAREFVDFLRSPEGAAIFGKWGWTTQR